MKKKIKRLRVDTIATPTWQSSDKSLQIYQGDVIGMLRKLPSKSVHCCVTSPPYWALRSYLNADDPLKVHELGSERTPEEHVAKMVSVFAEVRRVLRDDGLLWINYGEAYGGAGGAGGAGVSAKVGNTKTNKQCRADTRGSGLGALQRVGIPERFALAMQANGWLWRDTIIWRKLAPMPASLQGTAWVRCRVKVIGAKTKRKGVVTKLSEGRERDSVEGHTFQFNTQYQSAQYVDCPGCNKCRDTNGYVLRRGSWRTTPAHEYIFMFAKQAGYFADQEAVKEDCEASTLNREKYTRILDDPDEQFAVAHNHESVSGGKRNPRSVMTLKMHNLKERHYAAFPPSLPSFCLKASTSERGCCPKCGAQWARVLRLPPYVGNQARASLIGTGCARIKTGPDAINRMFERGERNVFTVGWRPTCTCNAGESVPATVLDIFGGSGTTALAAARLGRKAILIELNPEYVEIAQRRLEHYIEKQGTNLFSSFGTLQQKKR